LTFVQTILGANPEAAYATFTSEAKQFVSRDQFLSIVRQAIQPAGPLENLHVAETHHVEIGTGAPNRVICGSLGRPEDWVAVAAKPVAKQAHLIIAGKTKNNDFAFVLWLIREKDWRVEHFHFITINMSGKSAQDIWNLARDQQRRNNNFNAAVLYAAARGLAYRGPSFQLGIMPKIESEMMDVPSPPELKGQAPFTWRFGNAAFKILQVGPIGVAGKIYLTITQEIAPWADNHEADQRNRELISEFTRAFPEYSDAFAGLVVGASERGGNRLYRTVYVTEDTLN
jgi:hypothetical protein